MKFRLSLFHRLVNILSCLDDLMSSGYSREIPVFGTIHGQLVTGIIVRLLIISLRPYSTHFDLRMKSFENLRQGQKPVLPPAGVLLLPRAKAQRTRNGEHPLIRNLQSRLSSHLY